MKTDIREQIKELATKEGIEPSVAEALAQKCWDAGISWRPYGGATSFKEIDDQRNASMFASKVEEETYGLRAIVDNIIDSTEIGSASDKAAAITSAANEYPKRIDGLKLGQKENKGFFDKLKSVFGSKEDEEPEPVELPEANGFKVFIDKAGKYRWLSYSSNAFEDKSKELFTTEALEEAVAYADKTKERGPLLVWHIPSAEIGTCDFQGLSGRILIESGTFHDTELGHKALDYYLEHPDQQVSIGYRYKKGDETDGQYDWFRFKERSVLPAGRAANPWTSFSIHNGEEDMRPDKTAELEAIFGKEMATTVISDAEVKTKELEGIGIRFKDDTTPELTADDIKTMETAVATIEDEGLRSKFSSILSAVEVKEVEAEATTPVVPTATETAAPVTFGAEQLQGLATAMVGIQNSLDALSPLAVTVKELQDQVKELQKTDDQKMGDIIMPRFNMNGFNRPSESANTVITDDKVKEALGEQVKDNGPVNPVQNYIDDLYAGKISQG